MAPTSTCALRCVPYRQLQPSLRQLDLGSSVFVCRDDAVIPHCSTRSDVTVIDRLDGEPLRIPLCALWLPSNPNPNVHAFMNQQAKGGSLKF